MIEEGRSYTLTKQSWKNNRRSEAPIRDSLATADRTTDLTVPKSLGHDLE